MYTYRRKASIYVLNINKNELPYKINITEWPLIFWTFLILSDLSDCFIGQSETAPAAVTWFSWIPASRIAKIAQLMSGVIQYFTSKGWIITWTWHRGFASFTIKLEINPRIVSSIWRWTGPTCWPVGGWRITKNQVRKILDKVRKCRKH